MPLSLGEAIILGRRRRLEEKKRKDLESLTKREGLAAVDALDLQDRAIKEANIQSFTYGRANSDAPAQAAAAAASANAGSVSVDSAAATGGMVAKSNSQAQGAAKRSAAETFGDYTKHTKIDDQETMRRTSAEDYGGGMVAFSSKRLKHSKRKVSPKAGLAMARGY